MKYALSVDWFQAYFLLVEPISKEIGTYITSKRICPGGFIPNYEVRVCKQRSAAWVESYSLAINGWDILHVYWKPRSPVMRKDSVSIKVANRALYCESWAWFLRDVVSLLHLKYMGLTRVDLCADFQTFADGLSPRTFIARYLADGSVSDGVQYIRRGSNMYHVVGRKRRTALGTGDVESTTSCHEYLRFGTRKSGVSAYLYNKSLELAESGKKKYIREFWERNGLIEDESQPVFRLEFSLLSKGMTYESKQNKSVFKRLGLKNLSVLQVEDFLQSARLADIFFSYAQKYWCFHQVTDVKYVKDMPYVTLFDVDIVPTIMPRDISRSLDSGRAERNAAATLERLATDYPDLTTDMAQSLHEASKTLYMLGMIKQVVFEETIPDEGWLFRPKTLPWKQLLKNYRARPKQENHLAKLCAKYVAREVERVRDEQFANLVYGDRYLYNR